jgi:hypothetical protein
MRTNSIRGVQALLCGVVAVLGCQSFALAKGVPPSANQILGTYSVRYDQTLYSFGNGIASKLSYLIDWEITPVSGNQVQVHTSTFNETFRAQYDNGLLIWGNGDDANDPSYDANIGYAMFSGTSGRIKMKGMAGYSSLGFWGMCETDALSGRMTFSTLSPDHGMAPVNVAAPSGADEAGTSATALPATFPGIDSLVGDYNGRFTGTKYYVHDGPSEKVNIAFTFRVAKVDSETLTINAGGDLIRAHYENGILMVATLDDSLLAGNTMFMLIPVKGSAGKISFKGQAISARDIGTVECQLDTATFTAKWVGDF